MYDYPGVINGRTIALLVRRWQTVSWRRYFGHHLVRKSELRLSKADPEATVEVIVEVTVEVTVD